MQVTQAVVRLVPAAMSPMQVTQWTAMALLLHRRFSVSGLATEMQVGKCNLTNRM